MITSESKLCKYAFRLCKAIGIVAYVSRFLMHEPRGHYDMYGAMRVVPDCEKADVAFLFMHNEGFSTMCGHAVIALGR